MVHRSAVIRALRREPRHMAQTDVFQYDPGLIHELEITHRGLLERADALLAATDSAGGDSIHYLAVELRAAIYAHVMLESYKIYDYLLNQYGAGSRLNLREVIGLRRDVERQNAHLLTACDALIASPDREALSKVCILLEERVQFVEKELYPHYAPV